MSTLWTPDGERPIPRADQPPAGGSGLEPPGPTDEELAAELAEARDRLSRTPAEVVVANHAYGLWELAALHLSLEPPQFDQARTAIDALAALVEGMRGRLGEPEAQLVEALGQLRLVFVEIANEARSAGGAPPAG